MHKLKLLLILIVLASPGCRQELAEEESILWLGSSSTYVHDLPLQSSQWLNDYGEMNTTAFLTGKSGTGFHEYMRDSFQAQYGLEPGEILLDKIRNEQNDYVVIQQITYFMADVDSSEIIQKTADLCDAIREAGGEPVFYEMGWRLQAMNQLGRDMILREAVRNHVKYYIPCSTAWTRVRKERPDLELHNLPDRDHPGTLGTYLNLCCTFAALTGTSPEGLPGYLAVWPRFRSFDSLEARKRLDTAELDYYHRVMPAWMQEISVMASQTTLDPSTVRYLQKVAWEVWNEINNEL